MQFNLYSFGGLKIATGFLNPRGASCTSLHSNILNEYFLNHLWHTLEMVLAPIDFSC